MMGTRNFDIDEEIKNLELLKLRCGDSSLQVGYDKEMIISWKEHTYYKHVLDLWFMCFFRFIRHATLSSKMWRIPKESTISFTDTRNQSFRRLNKRIHYSVLTSCTACRYRKAIGRLTMKSKDSLFPSIFNHFLRNTPSALRGIEQCVNSSGTRISDTWIYPYRLIMAISSSNVFLFMLCS